MRTSIHTFVGEFLHLVCAFATHRIREVVTPRPNQSPDYPATPCPLPAYVAVALERLLFALPVRSQRTTDTPLLGRIEQTFLMHHLGM